jgi:hypothetical protein
VDARLKIWPDMVHVPHAFTAVSEVARLAVTDAAKYIKDQYALHHANLQQSPEIRDGLSQLAPST